MAEVHKAVYKAFSALGVPGALQAFPKGDGAPAPPFFVYRIDGYSGFCADDGTYLSVPEVSVELYESEADFGLEERFREVAEGFGPCRVEEVWVTSEHCREVAYTFDYTPAPSAG